EGSEGDAIPRRDRAHAAQRIRRRARTAGRGGARGIHRPRHVRRRHRQRDERRGRGRSGREPAAADLPRLMPRLSLDRGPLLPALLLVPAAVLLGGLLAFPLALGVLLGFKDATIGEAGSFIGL